MQVAKGKGCIDLEASADHPSANTHRRVGVVHIFQNLAAALHIFAACIGEREAACGAVQQAGVEGRFQLQHQARDHGFGGIQPLGGLHKTAGLHHGHEGLHLAKLVHGGAGS